MAEIEQTAENDARPVCDCAPDCSERIVCDRVGEVGHFACGWCETHGRARHVCMCLPTRTVAQRPRPIPPAKGEAL